jgi:serine/threonine-protein kinase HipA
MRKGLVFYQGKGVGEILENEDGVTFSYYPDYLADPEARPVSLTLPLDGKPYRSETMIPFFDGLIPEGWLLDLAGQYWKINTRDRFGLLLACCRDCIGAVSIVPFEGSES